MEHPSNHMYATRNLLDGLAKDTPREDNMCAGTGTMYKGCPVEDLRNATCPD